MIANPGAKLLDLLVYSGAVTVVVTLGSGVVVLATGGGWVELKVALFLVGFLLFGGGSLALWRASSPAEVERPAGTDGGRRKRSPFEAALARAAPPVDGLVPVERRFPPALKLFVSSLVVLGLSLALEVVFGVGVD